MVGSRSRTRSLEHAYDVVVALVSRDHRGRYKSTAMGMFWSVASPVLFLLTFYFLFKVVLAVKVDHFLSFTFIGIVFWNWLAVSLMEGVSGISSNANLVGQPGFPVATLPMVPVASNLINLFLSFPVVLIVLLADGVHPGATLLFLPVIMTIQFILILGLLYLLTAANVFFRDVQYMLPIALQLGYFMTPIFYELDHVPARLRIFLELNPMVPLIEAYRSVILHGTRPQLGSLAVLLAASLLLLSAGHRIFTRATQLFLEEI